MSGGVGGVGGQREIDRSGGVGGVGGADLGGRTDADAGASAEPGAVAEFNRARMAASGQAAQVAQMARLMEVEERSAAAAPIKTSIDGQKGDIDWTKYKPTKADKTLVEDLAKLPEDEIVARLGTLTPRDRDRLVQISYKILGGGPNAISNAVMNRAADIEAAFIRTLADMPEADFKAWFLQSSMKDTDAIAKRFNADAKEIFGDDMDNARKLMDRFNGLKEERAMKKVLQHYTGETDTTWGPRPSEKDIQQEIAARLRGPDGTFSDEGAARVVSDMRLLAANPSPEAQEVYETYARALEKAVGKNNVWATILAKEAAKLDGPGSADVKGAIVATIYEKIDAGVFVPNSSDSKKYLNIEYTVEALIRSDPAGVLEVMEGADLEGGKKLVNRAIADIAKLYEKDHAALESVMSDILAPFAADVALAAAAEPWDAKASTNLDSKAHDLGVALGAVQNAVDGLGEDARKKIAHGAFILEVFNKGVAKISGVPAIEKVGNKIVDFLADKENEAVSDWTGKIKEAASRTVDEVFQARTEGMDRAERRRRQDPFEMALNSGFDAARKLKGKK